MIEPDDRALTSMKSAVSNRGKSFTELLTGKKSAGTLVQELAPISESVPWRRSQRYWASAGVDVFTSGEVPYVVTNDGEQSRKAVQLYVASLRKSERLQRREPVSYVLELGTGSGLFAKLFLDQLKAQSEADGTLDYERTIYIASDNSPGLLGDTRDSGVFFDHEERVIRLNLPSRGMQAALLTALPEAVGAIRAVHANYVLDSLPFTILSTSDVGVFELRIRTLLREDPRQVESALPLEDGSKDLASWFVDGDGKDAHTLHQLLSFESEYVQIDPDSLPRSELIPPHESSAASLQLIHSFGAVECLEELFEVMRPDGYLVAMDYGYDGSRTEPLEFQCFGRSVAAGVNFSQLVAYASGKTGVAVAAPKADPASIQARLFARDEVADEVVQDFRELYSKEAWERTEAPYLEAVALVQRGHYEAARWRFEEAHRLQPYNWNLLEAIIAFLTYTLEEHDTAVEVAKRALQLNHLSPRLWNLLGDCYYSIGAIDSAERAYLQATKVNPHDVRGRTNLAYIFLKQGSYVDALHIIGEALALDSAGTCREELLGKQMEALQGLTASHARSVMQDISRLSGHHALPGRKPRNERVELAGLVDVRAGVPKVDVLNRRV